MDSNQSNQKRFSVSKNQTETLNGMVSLEDVKDRVRSMVSSVYGSHIMDLGKIFDKGVIF